MKWPSNYRGWDDRRLPVKLVPSRWAAAVLIGGPVLSILTMAAVITRRDAGLLVTALWSMPILVVCCAATLATVQYQRFKRLAPRRLARGECPRCRYQIDDLPVEEDGATVCPECGAAWVLPGMAKKG